MQNPLNTAFTAPQPKNPVHHYNSSMRIVPYYYKFQILRKWKY